MEDKIVKEIVKEFSKRSEIGVVKYGTTLEGNDDGTLRFLRHLREELMDATLYTKKLETIIADTLDSEMEKVFETIMNAMLIADNERLLPCDIEECFYACGYELDKQPF